MGEPSKTKRIALGETREGGAMNAAIIAWEISREQFPFQRTKVWLPRGGHLFSSSHPVLVVTQEVLTDVGKHASETLEREVGGFLIGNRYFCPVENREYVMVDNFWRARFTSGDSVSLDLTADAWADFNDQLTTKFRGKLLVGWYHSHPRMDVFLSSDDIRIHQSRFAEPWMVALVIEPEKNLGGFFGWRNGCVHPNQPIEFFEYFGHRVERSVVTWGNYFSDGAGAEPAVARRERSTMESSRNGRRVTRVQVAAMASSLLALALVLLLASPGGHLLKQVIASLHRQSQLAEELPPPPVPAFMAPVAIPENNKRREGGLASTLAPRPVNPRPENPRARKWGKESRAKGGRK